MTLRDQLQRTLGTAYTIERELGGGGMSRVFVATENALGRRVVVKVLPDEMSGQLSADRFKREISIAARLQHAHVVPLLAAGEVDGLPYFTMPYVEGESLRARLAREGELPLTDAVRMLREIASALAYAHAHDVVHRDIKPDNVLLSGGAAMVTDFGVAKAVDAAGTQGAIGVTSVGVALGTPAYMSPEQATADPHVDHRADLYAWGMMAYELIGGQAPFAGRSLQATLAAHVTEVPEDIRRRRPAITPALGALIMRCLEKRPADRPQSADELVRTLDAIGTPSGGGSPPTSAVRVAATGARRRNLALAGVVVALVAAAGAWFARRGSAEASAAGGEMTLAVLPIENLGGDSTVQYLADGMTGELSSALKKVPGLQVAGDVSTFQFKGTHTAPAEIARRLGVRMLLTGKLQPGRGRVRLQMQLANADGKLLWSNTYDRENKDNFAMQDEITGAVANEMRVVLSPVALAVARAGRTVSPGAHDLFLRGQFEKNKLSPEGLNKALDYFQAALRLDSTYAQAYAGVAFAYDMQADAYAPSHEYHMLALAAARRAVQCDSLLAEARVLYGFELAAANWDVDAGRAEMARGLALNPNSPDGLFMYAAFLWLTGENDKAVAVADHLGQVDPLSPIAARMRADALLWGGRFAEALRQDSIATKMDSTVILIESTKGNVLRELGRFDESVATFLAFEKANEQPAFGLAITYGRMGKRDEGLRVIRALEARERRQWVDPDFIAWAYAGIGDRDHAMEWAEKAFQRKAWGLRGTIGWDCPWWRPLRDDPRFIELKKKVLATKFTS
jgi:TolB-like protein/tRNA A-37 threonylcarbamoyl transferase component Bud32